MDYDIPSYFAPRCKLEWRVELIRGSMDDLTFGTNGKRYQSPFFDSQASHHSSLHNTLLREDRATDKKHSDVNLENRRGWNVEGQLGESPHDRQP